MIPHLSRSATNTLGETHLFALGMKSGAGGRTLVVALRPSQNFGASPNTFLSLNRNHRYDMLEYIEVKLVHHISFCTSASLVGERK
jgi:hypothetical protein